MTQWPPPYPRVPHLCASPAVTRDDLLLTDLERARLVRSPVVLEEKLDGANVAIWFEPQRGPQVAGRGGPGAMDRGGQLGPLRAWVAARSDSLRKLLGDNRVLYGEWLWRRHTVRYSGLHDWLVGLDIFDVAGTWLEVRARDAALRDAGIAVPPLVTHRGPSDCQTLLALSRTSTFGDENAEGLVVRAADGGASSGIRLAKVVAPSFSRFEDEEWGRARAGNALRST